MGSMIKDLKKYGFASDNRTYVVAEIGINHGGSVSVAKELIDSAARTGADAVKFQTYVTEKRAPEGNQVIYDILKRCELPFGVFRELSDHAKECGLEFFSTPFDEESVVLLQEIGCKLFKIASFDVVNHALLRVVAKTRGAVIMSVGMSTLEEIQEAYKILKSGTDKIAILHCVSSYPMKEEDAELGAICSLKEAFDCIIGYSDHTPDIAVPIYAVAAGAQIIEKHFKIDDGMDCVDAPVSITEEQMKRLVGEIRRMERVFGDGVLGLRAAEQGCEVFRRVTT